MSYNSINFKKINKTQLIFEISKESFPKPTKKDLKTNQKLINESISNGNYELARNTLFFGFYFDRVETLDNIKKKGLFKYSKYISKKCIISNLAEELLVFSKAIGENSPLIINYLTSIINLAFLHSAYYELHKHIFSNYHRFKKNYKDKSIIKTLIAYIDFLFLSNQKLVQVYDPMDISSRTNEEIGEATSYLIFLFTERFKTSYKDTIFVADEYIKSGEIFRLIIASCFILDYKEFEVYVDSFNYSCIKNGDNLKIIPFSEAFDKSIQYGYIRSQLQAFNDYNDFKDAASIEDIANQLLKVEELAIFEIKETLGHKRYTLSIPEPIYEIIADKFLKTESLFKEEIIYLRKLFKEQLLSFDDLKSIIIRDNLSLFEFLKIRRLFFLFYLLFSKEILKREQKDINIVFRSLLPVYRKDVFYEFVGKITSKENLDTFLAIVCWEPGEDVHFDLQYYPIVFLDGYFILPLAIFAHSNPIRNMYASEYKKDNKSLLSDGKVDRLVNKLHSIFKIAGINSFIQTSYKKTDMDVFAILDDSLFIFECKHSLEPTSAFDLRTSHDYIRKAEKQLDYLTSEYESGNLIPVLELKYKLELSHIKNAIFCIVVSNRLFNGNAFRYPVRNIFEIDNILTAGIMRTNKGVFRIWESKTLLLIDLLKFFGEDNEEIKLMNECLSCRTLKYGLLEPYIEFDKYYLSSEKFSPILDNYTEKLECIELY